MQGLGLEGIVDWEECAKGKARAFQALLTTENRPAPPKNIPPQVRMAVSMIMMMMMILIGIRIMKVILAGNLKTAGKRSVFDTSGEQA